MVSEILSQTIVKKSWEINLYLLENTKQGLELSCLTPLSTICQLYRGGQFYCWTKQEHLEKTTDLSQITDKLDHIMLYQVHLAMHRVGTNNYSVAVIFRPCFWGRISAPVPMWKRLFFSQFHELDLLRYCGDHFENGDR